MRDADDPLRLEMEVNDETAQALKSELDRLAGDRNSLSDSDMRALCDRLALRDAPVKCTQGAAGYAAELTLRPRQHVMREHVAEHLHADERIRVFIYGHTHELETGWALNVEGGAEVRVHNTGAFQRTIHEEEFIDRMKAKNVKPSEALRAIKLEDLPPCYSALLVTYESGAPKSKTWRWHMPEDGTGTLVEPDSPLCQ